MGSNCELLSGLCLAIFIRNSFTFDLWKLNRRKFVSVLKSSIKLSMYEESVQDATAVLYTTEVRHFWTLTIETDGLDKTYRSVGLRDHPVSFLPTFVCEVIYRSQNT